MLRVFFGFAEHQETATYGVGYKLTITGNSDNSVLKIKITQSTMLKTKLTLLNGMYRLIQPLFHNRLYFPFRFQIRQLQNSNIWRDLSL